MTTWDSTVYNWDDVACSWDGTTGGTLTRLSVVEGSGQATIVGTDFADALVVKAWDGLNAPVVNQALSANILAGMATFPDGGSAAVGVTDDDGLVVWPTITAGTLSGAFTVAFSSFGGPTVTAPMSILADVPSVLSVFSGSGQTAEVGQTYGVFWGQVFDQYANPVAGVPFVFSAPTTTGSPSLTFGGSSTSPVASNAQGNIMSSAGPQGRANLAAGDFAVSLSPTVVGLLDPVTFDCTNTAGPIATLLAAGGSPQSAPVGADYQVGFAALVADQYGNGAPGIEVVFTAPDTSPSGTFPGGTNISTVTSGPGGLAVAETFTADQTTGTFRVAATTPTLTAEALFLCTNMVARDPLFDDLDWQFVSPDGEGIGLLVLRGKHGRLMPSVELWEEQVPGVPGYRYLGARHSGREMALPCFVEFPDATGLDALRQLARVLDPTKGIGSMRVNLPDGTVRQIGATYAGGLDAATEDNPAGIWAPLVFRCPDPYWTDGIEQSAQSLVGATEIEIVNDGDYETWPVIHLNSQGIIIDRLVLTNTATNLKIQLTAQTPTDILIDCRPGRRSVLLNGNPNYGAMTADSELFPLVAGSQIITIATTNAPTARVTTFTWARRFLAL